ncbi:MAG: molybdenum ABC transporter ATP-binding protein [Rhizobiaceae bacterium]|nr:molybdenum ABC transporter ATP-binding protein [Rhizobiaceae bacterium]
MTISGDIEVALSGQLGGFALGAQFSAPGRGITALFGPSGCGKTTILRSIAGLQRLDGICRVGSETWQDERTFLPPHRRAVGYVFQEASLFPHMSVRRNLLYASRGRVPEEAPGVVSFDEVIELLGLAPLLVRAPQHLSGGERQRVAVGRALLSQPRLLLMDEPLSALDRETRDEILPFLERLHETLAIPLIYVTHDLSEVERLADHVVLMQAGEVVAAGPLADIQTNIDLPLSRQRDAAVSIEARVAGYDDRYGLLELDVEGGRFLLPAPPGHEPEARLRLRVGAGDVSITREEPCATSILNVMPAQIVSSRAINKREMVLVLGLGDDGKGASLLARVTRRSWDLLGLAEGQRVYAQVKGAALASR